MEFLAVANHGLLSRPSLKLASQSTKMQVCVTRAWSLFYLGLESPPHLHRIDQGRTSGGAMRPSAYVDRNSGARPRDGQRGVPPPRYVVHIRHVDDSRDNTVLKKRNQARFRLWEVRTVGVAAAPRRFVNHRSIHTHIFVRCRRRISSGCLCASRTASL